RLPARARVWALQVHLVRHAPTLPRADARVRLAEGERQPVEESARAVPDVLVAPTREHGPEVFTVALAHEAAHAVRADHEVAVGGERFDVFDLGAESQFDAEFVAALLQDV